MDNVKYISEQSIREIYNASQYPTLIANEKLRKEFLRNSHLEEPGKKALPWCTHSQMIRYYDEKDQWVVEVHQYLLPDNTIGASGKPDPKRLRIRGTVFSVNIQKKMSNFVLDFIFGLLKAIKHFLRSLMRDLT